MRNPRKIAIATPRMLNGAIDRRIPRVSYQGRQKITTTDSRKLSNKREAILDNTEPCQTNKRLNQCW